MNKLCIRTVGLLVTIGFISGCCSWNYSKEDFEFTQNELALMGAYNIGDTIYFESNFGDIDTITVVEFSEERHKGSKCFISRKPSNYMAINISHLPSRITKYPSTKWTTDKNGKDVTYQSLISISKSPLDSIKKTEYVISFKGFTTLENIFENSPNEFIINGKTLSNCYKVTHGYPERVTNPDDIETVYWTPKYGLTAYTNKVGETWVIKNLD
ncbi:MAG: hypothetical protein H3C31_12655 [Brumimicrobium sp.]|nr:hypothetical protein [Brumimicrobium sp.]